MADVSEKARVSVFVGSYRVDVTIPLHLRVGNAIPELVKYLKDEFEKAGKDTALLEDKDAQWTLTLGMSGSLPANETLDELGVHTGDILYLEKTSAKETYPALIDDVPDSIASFQKQKFPAWDNAAAQRLAAYVAPAVAILTALLACVAAVTPATASWFVRAPFLVGLLIVAAGCITVAFLCAKKSLSVSDPLRKTALPAAACGLALLTPVGFLLLPAEVSYWHVLVAGGVVFTAAGVLRAVTSGVESATYVALTISSVAVVASALALWLGLTVTQFAAVAAVCALSFLIVFSSKVSMALADIPAPFVPTMGESHVNPMEEDITKLPTSASTRAIESIVNRERQIVDAHGALVGLCLGGAGAVVLAVTVMGATMDTSPMLSAIFVYTLCLAMLFRGRSYDDRKLQQVWLVSVVAALVCFTLALALTQSAPAFILPSLTLLLSGVMIATVVAVREYRVNSPVVMRGFELLEVVVNAAPIAYLAFLLDVYGKLRGNS